MKEQPHGSPARLGEVRKQTSRRERIYKRGSLLFIEGEAGAEMFVIRSGKVRLLRQEGDNTVVTEVCGPGGIIGEMSLLTHEPRSVTAQVVEDTVVTVIDEDLYSAVLDAIPSWLGGALQSLVKRLLETIRHTGEEIVRKSLVAVVRILLLLGEHEGKTEGGGLMLSLHRAREELHACTGLSELEIERAFLHLILKRMILIRKDDMDREHIFIKKTDVLCLYLEYLSAQRRGESLPGERLSLAAFDIAGFLLAAEGLDRCGGAVSVTTAQLEALWRSRGRTAPFDVSAFEQLAGEGRAEKKDDGSFVFSTTILSRLHASGSWLSVFKEDVKL